jgi:hypothetical protein
MNPLERQHWPEQYAWLCEKLEAFKKVFAPLVKRLNASDYVPTDLEEQGMIGDETRVAE